MFYTGKCVAVCKEAMRTQHSRTHYTKLPNNWIIGGLCTQAVYIWVVKTHRKEKRLNYVEVNQIKKEQNEWTWRGVAPGQEGGGRGAVERRNAVKGKFLRVGTWKEVVWSSIYGIDAFEFEVCPQVGCMAVFFLMEHY